MGKSLPQHEGRTPTYFLTPVFRQDYGVLDKKVNVVVHACNPNTWEWRQEDQEFKVNLVYVAGFKDSLDYMIPGLKLCLHSRAIGPFPNLRLLHGKQTPENLITLFLCGIISSAVTLRCLRACQFLDIASRSLLDKVTSRIFSLGTLISVFMLPPNYSPAMYHLPPI